MKFPFSAEVNSEEGTSKIAFEFSKEIAPVDKEIIKKKNKNNFHI